MFERLADRGWLLIGICILNLVVLVPWGLR